MNTVFLSQLLIGAALLTLGRKLFWLFVAGVGFVTAIALASPALEGRPDWLVLVVALGAGLLGAVLAIFLKRIAIALAGFVAGGYFAVNFLSGIGFETADPPWLPFVIGGIVGAVLASALFDWALILLSSLTGAVLITESFHLAPPMAALAIVGLSAAGIAIQAGLMRGEKKGD